MQEGYNKPSFGSFLIKVLGIVVTILLIGFIIWGVMELADSSDTATDIVKGIGGVLLVGLIGLGVYLLVRFFQRNNVSLNLGRVIGLIAGLVLLGLIVWGVFTLADTSDNEGVVDVADNESSTITVDGSTDEPSSESSTDERNSSETDNETDTSPDVAATDTDEESSPATSTPNTGPVAEDLPNTGIESAFLPALSLGALAYAARSYRASRQQLKQI